MYLGLVFKTNLILGNFVSYLISCTSKLILLHKQNRTTEVEQFMESSYFLIRFALVINSFVSYLYKFYNL